MSGEHVRPERVAADVDALFAAIASPTPAPRPNPPTREKSARRREDAPPAHLRCVSDPRTRFDWAAYRKNEERRDFQHRREEQLEALAALARAENDA